MVEANMQIQYSSWDVSVSDMSGAVVAELKCKKDNWLSQCYSGTGFAGDASFSIKYNSKKITLAEGSDDIGMLRISNEQRLHNHAAIEINGVKFFVIQQNPVSEFELLHSEAGIIGKITGKEDPKWQKNFFGLFSFDGTILFSVAMYNEVQSDKKFLQLLLASGYCIRSFYGDL